MVSLNQEVPANPFSIERREVSMVIQNINVLIILRALKVLNPSLFIPAITPNTPSTKMTIVTARYCSALLYARSRKYEKINPISVLDNIIWFGMDLICVYMSLDSNKVYVNELPQIKLDFSQIPINSLKSLYDANTWHPADHLSTCVDVLLGRLVAL